jgi:hypothetical protein
LLKRRRRKKDDEKTPLLLVEEDGECFSHALPLNTSPVHVINEDDLEFIDSQGDDPYCRNAKMKRGFLQLFGGGERRYRYLTSHLHCNGFSEALELMANLMLKARSKQSDRRFYEY